MTSRSTDNLHTPGPWIFSGAPPKIVDLFGDCHVVVGPGGDLLAAVFYDPKTRTGWEDARLIAAAPDLLEALKAAEQYIAFKVGSNVAPEALQHARAAIAKANGEESNGSSPQTLSGQP